ncbi:MAG: 50S ribosomal protein L32, partial [Proteobacteria bacterium]|nr:50S ribosomal protein L32 [Pseudomonadota bacterium]MBU1742623.1 50S ribosomal protein L32 [Pseudomonadota bacterium]
AVPKRRKSRTRSRQRRSHNAYVLPKTVKCPQCGEPQQPHRACPSCGKYNGRQVIETEG